MTTEPPYPLDNDHSPNDPGNRLRERMNAITTPGSLDNSEGSRILSDLLYTAEERDILPFRVDAADALAIWRLVEIAKATKFLDDIDELRM